MNECNNANCETNKCNNLNDILEFCANYFNWDGNDP